MHTHAHIYTLPLPQTPGQPPGNTLETIWDIIATCQYPHDHLEHHSNTLVTWDNLETA